MPVTRDIVAAQPVVEELARPLHRVLDLARDVRA